MPVFLAGISTILGAIMFLRFGYAVGHAGLLGALAVIVLGHMVTVPTALALAEIDSAWREGILRVDNINLVTGLVAQGHVSAGFVARSSLISGVRNGSLKVNESEVLWLAGDAALDQMMVLLTRGENNPAAQFWLDQMHTPSIRELIRQDGYRFPWEETDA